MEHDLYARLAATGKPECPQCGYSLEGLPGPHRCPECGRPYGRDILTWRPNYSKWWIWSLVASPGLVIWVYQGWTLGMRRIMAVMIPLMLLVWVFSLRMYQRMRSRDHLSIDNRGISYCAKGKLVHHFDWSAVRAVTHRRLWTRIYIQLADGRVHRFPRDLAPKDVVAFVAAANQLAEASERQTDTEQDFSS